jgi:polar amino acid transport system substrate-binding protein
MIGAGLSITEERAKKVLFSKSYYPSGIAAAVSSETSNKKEKANQGVTNLSMLSGGKTFAVPTGTVADQFVLDRFPDARIMYFNSVLDCALAVKDGKADAAVYDKPILQNIAAKNEGLLVLNDLIIDDQYGFAVQLEYPELKKAIDETLAQLKADGTYNNMMKRWFPAKGNPEPMPLIELKGKNGVLRFGTAAVTEPMSFVDGNQKVVGFDIELATYVARTLGMQIQLVDMEFGAMLPALIAGKVDMIGAGLSITEERAKKVLFSESYYPSGIAAAVSSEQIEVIPTSRLNTLNDISDKRIGVYNGSIHDEFVAKTYPKASISRYTSTADMILSLKSNKIDAAFIDLIETNIAIRHNPEIRIISDDVYDTPLGMGFNKKNTALRAEFNKFLNKLKQDGTYNTIHQRWFVDDAENAVMPQFKNPDSDRILHVGVCLNALPYVSYANDDYIGFDIELIRKFSEEENYHLKLINIEFPSLIAAISTGKVDIIAAGISITEERSQMIDFSDSYALFKTAVIVIDSLLSEQGKTHVKGEVTTFLKKISKSFYSNIIYEKRYLLIIHGLKITLIISLFAALFGTLIGGLICFMRMSKRKVLSLLARLFISLIRGTPVLVLLMIIFYVVFASVNINPVVVAIMAFGLNFGAYVSEMFRTSIESIDNGQKEAGIASGFTKIQTFIHIIMPQALRHVIPVYKGEFISLVKMTSIVGYIAVQDLTKASDIIRSRTFDAFFPLIMVAVLYLIISWLLTWGLSYVELSVDPKRKHKTKEEEVKL